MVPEGSSVIEKLLVDHGADVNHKDQYGTTALLRAALLGNLKEIKNLLRNGANVNATGKKPHICFICH